MWSGALPLAYGLWRFNSDCTELVTHRLPADTFLEYGPGATDGEWHPETSSPLTTATERLALVIDADTDTASLPTSVSNTAVFEEYGRVLHLKFADALTADYVRGPTRYSALHYVQHGAT